MSQKGTATLSIVTLKGLTDFDVFGTNIPETTGHQMAT